MLDFKGSAQVQIIRQKYFIEGSQNSFCFDFAVSRNSIRKLAIPPAQIGNKQIALAFELLWMKKKAYENEVLAITPIFFTADQR